MFRRDKGNGSGDREAGVVTWECSEGEGVGVIETRVRIIVLRFPTGEGW